MNIRILLPSVVRILRDRANQSIHTDHSEFHLYYRNFIFPLREEWDVQIVCRYGKNRGDCWYMSDNFPRDVNDFPLIVRVVDEEGEILAEKEVKVRLYDKHFDSKPFSVMFFGDSMTHGGVYPLRVVERLANIKSEGTRSFNGWLRLEGRGGWSFTQYLNGFDARSCKPTSPFLFPEGEEGAYYWGDEANWAAIRDEAHDTYRFDGYTYEECQEGFTFLRKGALYCRNNGQDTLVAEKPVFSFAFDKYLARNRIHDLGAVSILMGANDLQCTPAADLSGALTQYIQGMKTVVDSIRQSDERTAVILNIPVPGTVGKTKISTSAPCTPPWIRKAALPPLRCIRTATAKPSAPTGQTGFTPLRLAITRWGTRCAPWWKPSGKSGKSAGKSKENIP